MWFRISIACPGAPARIGLSHGGSSHVRGAKSVSSALCLLTFEVWLRLTVVVQACGVTRGHGVLHLGLCRSFHLLGPLTFHDFVFSIPRQCAFVKQPVRQ